MTIEDMKQGVSKIRNPVIARAFRELGLIEQWGSGVRRIFNQAADQKLPEPQITEIGMRVRFVVPLAVPISVAKGKNAGGKQKRPESKAKKATQSPTQSADPILRMLELLLDGPLSSGVLREKLGLKHRPTFRENSLHPALKKGYIKYTIPKKPNSRLQIYQLTEKGRTLVLGKS